MLRYIMSMDSDNPMSIDLISFPPSPSQISATAPTPRRRTPPARSGARRCSSSSPSSGSASASATSGASPTSARKTAAVSKRAHCFLFPSLIHSFGSLSPGAHMAHEWQVIRVLHKLKDVVAVTCCDISRDKVSHSLYNRYNHIMELFNDLKE